MMVVCTCIVARESGENDRWESHSGGILLFPFNGSEGKGVL